MKEKQRLIFLVGMIGSGKSTFARRMADAGYLVYSNDAVIPGLHAGNYHGYRDELRETYRRIQRSMVSTLLALGHSVVLDDTHTRASSRKEDLRMASYLGVPCDCVLFPIADPPAVHAVRRYNHDSRGNSLEKWQEVLEKHLAGYVPPSLEEGFLRIFNPEQAAIVYNLKESPVV